MFVTWCVLGPFHYFVICLCLCLAISNGNIAGMALNSCDPLLIIIYPIYHRLVFFASFVFLLDIMSCHGTFWPFENIIIYFHFIVESMKKAHNIQYIIIPNMCYHCKSFYTLNCPKTRVQHLIFHWLDTYCKVYLY